MRENCASGHCALRLVAFPPSTSQSCRAVKTAFGYMNIFWREHVELRLVRYPIGLHVHVQDSSACNVTAPGKCGHAALHAANADAS